MLRYIRSVFTYASLAIYALCCQAESIILSYQMPDFSEKSYHIAVSSLLENFEKTNNCKIKPAKTGKIALKIDTKSAPVMCVKENLIEALANQLVSMGFKRKNILIIGQFRHELSRYTYLNYKSYKLKNSYKGMPILSLEDLECTHKNWHYEHSLIGKNFIFQNTCVSKDKMHEAKESMLPTILMFEVDFWINLPTFSGHKDYSVDGALTNASIRNITNAYRFFDNPENGAQAIAEIASIPELTGTYLFTIASLEQINYANCSKANYNYICNLHELVLSKDMLSCDRYVLKIINKLRSLSQLKTNSENNMAFFYSENLNIGSPKFKVKQLK